VAKAAGELSANSDGRAQVITLALVLGAAEARTPKDAWRRNTTTSQWSHAVSSADYLRWLADNGYPLAAVEEIVTGAKDSEGVSIRITAARAGWVLCSASHCTAQHPAVTS
jgi:ParB family chromosome partitioning protein